jgi:acetyl esterase/lipase
MCRCRASLLLLTIAALASPVRAQQDSAPSVKKADSQVGNINLPPRSAENWKGLTDLKSGLEPRPPVPIGSDEQPDFVRDMIRLQWRNDDLIEVWVIRPKVGGKVPEKLPVILYLYSYPDTSDRFRDNGWCKRATADGFAAVGFVGAMTDYRFHSRPMKEWFVSELPEALGSTTHDVQLILNYLAQRRDMDLEHVGMFGMGSGGAIAILAAQADPRITTLDVLDPWGDWAEWLKNSPAVPSDERPKYLTKEFLQSVSGLDPVSYLPALHTPNIRLQQTVSEPVTPPAAKEMIGAAVPHRTTVVRYQNVVDLLNAWKVAGLSGWIKQQMRAQTTKGQNEHIAINE